ncbi:MAG: flagellar protein [Alkaliphilus sp.]|nr:flagellar protein [Alkaliphilus transvaalensis]MBN4069416.1 flagellar protein [bacterium AH-315-G05]PHS35248.1 MAG: flagellar protein [Alkaliphilus sp.]
MYNNMKIQPNSIKQIKTNTIQQKKNAGNFNNILNDQIKKNGEIKFSKHAMNRLEQRDISLSFEEKGRISKALSIAGNKGIKETLILMDNKIFVASVRNRTIITATLEGQLKESTFTNIDGAVII